MWTFKVQNNSKKEVFYGDSVTPNGAGHMVSIQETGTIFFYDGMKPNDTRYSWWVKIVSGDQEFWWGYEGTGDFLLIVNEDDTFAVDPNSQNIRGQIRGPKAMTLRFPVGVHVIVKAMSISEQVQRVTIQPEGESKLIRFEGAGINFINLGETRFVTKGPGRSRSRVCLVMESSPDGKQFHPSRLDVDFGELAIGSFATVGGTGLRPESTGGAIAMFCWPPTR